MNILVKLRGARIGYVPYSNDLSAPGDRRRFVFYATANGIPFEIADPEKPYDIVYLGYGCDIARWLAYKKTHPACRIIFELVDSYLFERRGLKTLLRGSVKYMTGQESSLSLDYRSAVIRLLAAADAVVCSTDRQKKIINRYNPNVHISLDYFSDDITRHKSDYTTGDKLKLIWEGLAYTVQNLLAIRDALHELRDEIELIVVTDPVVKGAFRLLDKPVPPMFRHLGVDARFVKWEKNSFSELIAGADMAIIPMINDRGMMWEKPENKLLLLWEIGLPTLTSDTPAYVRTMNAAAVDGICHASAEWVSKIRAFKALTPAQREAFAAKAQAYLRENYSKEQLIARWNAIFESVIKQQ